MGAVDIMGEKTFSQMNVEGEVGGAPFADNAYPCTYTLARLSPLSCYVSSLKRDVQDWQWLMAIGAAANYKKNPDASQRWGAAPSRFPAPSLASVCWMSCTSNYFSPDYFRDMAAVISGSITWYLHKRYICTRDEAACVNPISAWTQFKSAWANTETATSQNWFWLI